MALQTPSPTLYVSNLEPKTKKPGACGAGSANLRRAADPPRTPATALCPLHPLRQGVSGLVSLASPRPPTADRNSIDIVAKKHGGGRGQAFVVFAEQAAATAAMRGLSGEPFYERDLARVLESCRDGVFC